MPNGTDEASDIRSIAEQAFAAIEDGPAAPASSDQGDADQPEPAMATDETDTREEPDEGQPADTSVESEQDSEDAEAPEADDPFADIPDEGLDEDALAMKKRLQAAYTRKTQELAEKRKEVQAEADELAALREKVERLEQARTGDKPEQGPEQFGVNDFLAANGLGDKLIEADDITTTDDISLAFKQREAINDFKMAQTIRPLYENLYRMEAEVFFATHPDARDYGEQIVEMATTKQTSLGEAYEAIVVNKQGRIPESSAEERELEAYRLGLEAGKRKAAELEQTRDRISVPSGRGGRTTGEIKPTGTSIAELWEANEAALGVAGE